jgi:DNA-binding response OmpR family regulator
MPERRGLRVLVVEDDWACAETLAYSLRAAGHEVEIAPDGLSALEAIRAARPHVVLLDLTLPGLDGYAVAVGVHEQHAPMRPLLVALTGQSDDESRRRSREAGIDLHLVKPADPEKLHQLLRRFQSVVEDVDGFDPMI